MVQASNPTFRIARMLWLLIYAIAVILFLLGLGSLYSAISSLSASAAADLTSDDYLSGVYEIIQSLEIRPANNALLPLGLITIVFALYIGIAGLIFERRPADRLALIIVYILLGLGMMTGQTVLSYGIGRLNPDWCQPFIALLNAVGWSLFFSILWVVPNGRFVPRLTRWALAIWVLGWIVERYAGPSVIENLTTLYAVVALLVAAWAQSYRYRKESSPQERQRTKWVLWGLILFLGLSLMTFPFNDKIPEALSNDFTTLLLVIMPVTLGIAVLKSGLWDMDLVIRKTLLYSTLTVILGSLYFATVLMVQSIFTAVSGQGSPLAVVISTLAIAALFQSLRQRLQAFIDRRFYRRKYDAALTLTQFAQSARDEEALDQLSIHCFR